MTINSRGQINIEPKYRDDACIRSLIYQLFTSLWICVWKELKMVDAHVANRCHCLSIIDCYTHRHTDTRSVNHCLVFVCFWVVDFIIKIKKPIKLHIYTDCVLQSTWYECSVCAQMCGFNIKFSNLPLALWSASTCTTTRHLLSFNQSFIENITFWLSSRCSSFF